MNVFVDVVFGTALTLARKVMANILLSEFAAVVIGEIRM